MLFSSVRALVASSVLPILLFALAGCGGGNSSRISTTPPPPAPSEFLYATSNANVLVFSVDSSTGALTLEPNGPSAPGGFGIAATPSASFLYSSNDTAGGVAGFSIGQAGALSAVNGSPFLLPNDPPYSNLNNVDSLAMHPSGQFLYAPDPPANEVIAFGVDSTTGVLTPIAGSPFPAGTQPEQVVVTPSGQFLYVSDDDTSASAGGIWGFTINSSSGALTTIAGSPFPTFNELNPDGLVIHPSGKFLYSAIPYGNSVEAFSIDPTSGTLTEMPGSPFALGGAGAFPVAFSIAQDPAGKFLYALGSEDGRVYGFTVDANSGALTPAAGSPYGQVPTLFASSLTVDPAGKFLYFCGENSPYIGILSIDGATGALSAASESSAYAAATPYGMTIVSVPQR
jgi:6-phosphogluconolactonase